MTSSIRENLLKTELKRQIEDKYRWLDFSKYHHNTILGFYNSLSNLIIEASANPKKNDDNKLQGYHIYSKSIQNFKRNKIVQDIDIDNIAHRAYRSTYHANNSRKESNGYSHWYLFDEWVSNANSIANTRLIKMIQHNQKYEHTNEKYKNIVKEILNSCPHIKNKENTDYIKIHKYYFIPEYKNFKNGLSEQFSIVLNRVFYWDEDYVYVDNSSYNQIYNESLDGNGRSYTLVGLLSRDLRKRLLQNHVEYDIDTTAQTIFLNLYYMNTIKGCNSFNLKQLKKDFPEHYQLLTDKRLFRLKISHFFKVNSEEAKKIITHITYSPNSNVIHTYIKDKSAPTKSIAKDGMKAFIKESKQIRKVVLEKFYYQKNDHNPNLKIGDLFLKEFKPLIDEVIRINNLKLKGNGRGKKRDDRIAFRITELIEHQIRECMISIFEKLNVDNIYQIHDAVIIDKPLKNFHTKMIEAYVKKHLDFTISVSQKQL